jgi:L-asparaginase II
MAGVLGAGSPGVGIAVKIADGDISIRKANGESYNRARPAVVLEILRQMGYIEQKELDALAVDFGPTKPVFNLRRLVTGVARPVFTLQKPETIQ